MKRMLLLVTALALVAWGIPALAADCIHVDLGAQVTDSSPLPILSLYFSTTNCGDAPGMATFTISLEQGSQSLGSGTAQLYLPADKPFTQQLQLPVVSIIPAGTYTLCVDATLGSASDSACATVTLNSSSNVISFQKVEGPAPADTETWGAVKSMYK